MTLMAAIWIFALIGAVETVIDRRIERAARPHKPYTWPWVLRSLGTGVWWGVILACATQMHRILA